MRRITAGLSTAALATLLSYSTALAADADAFATRLKNVMSEQGFDMTYAEATSQGDNVVLKDVVFGVRPDRMEAGDLTFENVQGSTEAGWTADRLPIEDVEGSDTISDGETATYAFRDMAVENIQIVGTGSSTERPAFLQASPLFFDRARIGSIDVKAAGRDSLSLNNAELTNNLTDDGGYKGRLAISDFTVNVPEQSEDGSAETIRKIGYDQFNGSMTAESEWSPESGNIGLSPLEFDVDDVGTLTMSYEIGGYTPELIKSIQQMNAQMEANPGNNDNAGMAVMGILAQLQIRSVELAFEDDSLTQRLLDYYAEETGQSPENMIDVAVQIVQGSIGSVGDEAFQSQVTDAVRTFLQDPTSIRVASQPQNPIPVMQVFGAAMGAPQTIPNVLQLQIQANDGSTEPAGTETSQ